MPKNKKKHAFFRTCLDNQSWRRNRDLNPGTELPVYELSKPAPSASWVFLRGFKLNNIGNVLVYYIKKSSLLKEKNGKIVLYAEIYR